MKHALLVSAGALALACSAANTTPAPPPPRQGLPVAPGTVVAEPTAAPKGCACSLKRDATPTPKPEPAPISGELPVGPFDLERRSACTQAVCRLDAFLPDPSFVHTTREAVPSMAAMWLMTIAEDSTLVTPRSSELAALALVLEGQVVAGAGEPKKPASQHELSTWGALRAPDAGYFLKARGGRASVLMVLSAKQGSLERAIERAKREKPAAGVSSLETSSLLSAEKLAWGKGAYHARIAFPGGGPGFTPSLTLMQASGAGRIDEHVHSAEWENIAVLRGGGQMLLGNAKYAIEPGSIFHTPRGTVHGFEGSGTELAAVLVFTPGGPEQRFVGLSANGN